MSKTLTLIHGSWAAARSIAGAGRRADARRLLATLLARPDLPAGVAAAARRLAATLEYDADRFAACRKHLRAAIQLNADDADAHYQLGRAYENDPHGCDRRAARCYREAAGRSPGNAGYHAAFGRAAVRANAPKAGLRALKRAADLAPADAIVLAVVVEGMCLIGKLTAAGRVVTRGRFLAPADAGLSRLADRVRFAAAARRRPARSAPRAAPATLPFVRVIGAGGESRVVRRDAGSAAEPHFGRLRVRG